MGNKTNINDVLTVSEAAELDFVAEDYKDKKTAIRSLQAKLKRGSSFKHGTDCRKAGDTWLVTREAIEREYK